MDSPRAHTNSTLDTAAAVAALHRIAELARLELDPTRTAKIASDLGRVLAAFESLQVVDVEGVEPLHQPLIGAGSERDTRIKPPQAAHEREELLSLAPAKSDGFYCVPKTVGE